MRTRISALTRALAPGPRIAAVALQRQLALQPPLPLPVAAECALVLNYNYYYVAGKVWLDAHAREHSGQGAQRARAQIQSGR